MRKGKKIVLGITGSIAAYKSAVLARGLIKEGAEVLTVMTPAGTELITPLTMSTLTKNPVVSEFFSRKDGTWNSHVDIGLWADLMLIAPATASTIGKMAHGIADNMLITTYMSMKAPVLVAPAMDLDMYAHPATQNNLATLKSYGNIIIEPEEGELASSLVGKGRMAEPEAIIDFIKNFFSKKQSLKGKKIIITAGSTYEKIDPVRFIGNCSSGKMGYALAEECAERGADVQLISGPTSLTAFHSNITTHRVESAEEMYQKAISLYPEADAAILSAATADYTPVKRADEKIKHKSENLILELKPTKDIAEHLGKMKTQRQVLAGFALETNNEIENAVNKLQRKNFDFIVLNSLNDAGAGFGYDTNKISIIEKGGNRSFGLKTKKEVAADIVDKLCETIKEKNI